MVDLVSKNTTHHIQDVQILEALNSSNLVSITDPNGLIIYVNELFCNTSGYQESELLGKNVSILKTDNKTGVLFEEIRSLLNNNNPWKGEQCHKKINGTYFWLNSTIIPLKDENGIIEKYFSISTDITNTKMDSEKLIRLDNKFKLLFDSSPDAYFISDLSGTILKCNNAVETISGYKKKEFINKKIWNSVLISDTDSSFFSNVLKIPSKKPHKFEFQITSKQGKKIDIGLVCHLAHINGEKLFISIAQNITSSKETLNKLREKTKDLELLLYRSGHDLRTPFTSLEGLVNLMKLEPQNENTEELLDMFEKVLKNGMSLIDNLSTSSLIVNKTVKKEQVDVNQELHKVLKNLQHFEGFNNISFNVNISKGLMVNSNPQLLNSVFQNLLQNAIKYQRPCKNTHIPFIIINAFKTKEGITISIKDNGIGINKKDLGNVFDLYYRSNTTISGTGLGLYITKNTVEQLGGSIQVMSIVNKETIFDILLPN